MLRTSFSNPRGLTKNKAEAETNTHATHTCTYIRTYIDTDKKSEETGVSRNRLALGECRVLKSIDERGSLRAHRGSGTSWSFGPGTLNSLSGHIFGTAFYWLFDRATFAAVTICQGIRCNLLISSLPLTSSLHRG